MAHHPCLSLASRLSSPLLLVLLLSSLWACPAPARPIQGVSPFSTFSSCFRTQTPRDFVAHPLVVLGEPPSTATAQQALSQFLAGLARDFALRLCRDVALTDEDEELLQEETLAPAAAAAAAAASAPVHVPESSSSTHGKEKEKERRSVASSSSSKSRSRSKNGAAATTGRPRALALDHFDCDVLSGDFAVGVSRDYETNRAPVHAVYLRDPVEATLALHHRARENPQHPLHARLASMSLHDAIMEAGGLSDVERHHAALPFNTMTWRLCGFDCSPANMTLHEALERATLNLNTRVAAVLIEGSALWLELLQNTVRDSKLIAAAKRQPRLSSTLTPAELSIVEHANFADRILFSIAQGRELMQRKCMHSVQRTGTYRGLA